MIQRNRPIYDDNIITMRISGDTCALYKIYGDGYIMDKNGYSFTIQSKNEYEVYHIDFRQDNLLRHTVFDANFKVLLDKTYFYNSGSKLIDFIIEESNGRKSVQKFEFEYY